MMKKDAPKNKALLKVIFFGTDEFAVCCLKALAANQNVRLSLVITMPDRPKGRGYQPSPTPVKEWALQHNFEVITPEDLNETHLIERIKRLQPDVFVVVAYGKKLPAVWLNLPRLGAYNIHASLLPAYRGAAPVEWAIYHGEKKTGVSIIRMNEDMDAGDIVWQEEEPIHEADTGGSLKDHLAQKGARAMTAVLDRLYRREPLTARRQDPSQVSRAPRLTKSHARLDWTRPAVDLERAVRAFDPRPGAWTTWRGRRLRICAAQAFPQRSSQHPPGTIEAVTKEGWFVATGQGCLLITQVHPEGGRRMSAAAYAAGSRPKAGEQMS